MHFPRAFFGVATPNIAPTKTPLTLAASPCPFDDSAAHCQYRDDLAHDVASCAFRSCVSIARTACARLFHDTCTPGPLRMDRHRPLRRGVTPKRQLDSIIIHFVCKPQPRAVRTGHCAKLELAASPEVLVDDCRDGSMLGSKAALANIVSPGERITMLSTPA